MVFGATLPGPALATEAAPLTLPSGLAVALMEILEDEALGVLRFRFLARGLGEGAFDLRALKADVDFLCQTYALPHTQAHPTGLTEVVISLSSEPIPFGEIAPDVVQIFHAYRIDGGRCRWLPL